MYSDNKEDISQLKRGIFSVILKTILLIIGVQLNFSVEASASGSRAEVYSEIYQETNFIEDKLENNDIGISNLENNIVQVTSGTKFVENTNYTESTTSKINGYSLTIGEKIFGYIVSKDQKDKILNDVFQLYIEELGLNEDDIHYIEAEGDIELNAVNVSVNQIETDECIAEEIYNEAVKEEESIELTVNAKISSEEDVTSPIVYKEDESMYMGEIIEEAGEVGTKEVFTSITYNGLEKTNEELAEEILIESPKPTVIYKGMKNPYVDGVEFLNRPVDTGYISSLFNEVREASIHKGIDIAEATGTPVEAALYGTVVSAGYNCGGYGNLVVIEHDNNMQTYYAHLNDIYVEQGQEIATEEVIGTVGNTGFSTGPHLHFELRVDDNKVNPINYIKK